MLDRLLALIGHLGDWAYLVIVLGAVCESAAFLGLVVPGESLVMAAGFFAAQGLLALPDLVVLVSAGAILGDNIGYELGRRLGREWLLRHGARIGLRRERLARVEEFFRRHGGKTIFLGRFVGFARALAPFLAGASRMPYGRFFVYNALGAVLWSVAALLVGYFLGQSWRVVERWIGRGTWLLAGGVAVVVAIVWLRRRLGRQSAEDLAP